MQKIPTALKVQQIQWYHHNRLGESVKQRMDNTWKPNRIKDSSSQICQRVKKGNAALQFCFQPQGATATYNTFVSTGLFQEL